HNASDQLDLAQHIPGLVRTACRRGAAGYYDLIALLSRRFDLRTLPSAARMAESVGVCLMDGRMDAARLLIERGAVVDTTTLWGAARGDVSPGMIRELIALGADPAARVPRDGELESPYDGFAAIDYVWNRSFAWGSPPDSSAAPYVLHELAVAGPPPLSGARLEDIAIDGL